MSQEIKNLASVVKDVKRVQLRAQEQTDKLQAAINDADARLDAIEKELHNPLVEAVASLVAEVGRFTNG